MNVQGRDYILIHLANDAKKELLGCIAPVAKHTGIGKGSKSLTALEKLKTLVYTVFDRNEEVKISILDSCLRGKDKEVLFHQNLSNIKNQQLSDISKFKNKQLREISNEKSTSQSFPHHFDDYCALHLSIKC